MTRLKKMYTNTQLSQVHTTFLNKLRRLKKLKPSINWLRSSDEFTLTTKAINLNRKIHAHIAQSIYSK